MIWRLIGYALVGVALILVVVAVYVGGTRRTVPLVFSPPQLLGTTWRNYKAHYIEASTGRTLDPSRGNITTSEGQSYTMLRAVWQDDQATFDQSWQWTKDNLHRPNDRLSAWLFGKRADGTYGILTTQGGLNNATDADQDIALALVFAYARWQNTQYLGDARVIANDIWDKDVVTIGGKPYLAADDVELSASSTSALINVSYINPVAYRVFAAIDPKHPWMTLLTNSYDLIGKTITAPLGGTQAGALPPDWVRINKKTGALSAAVGSTTTNYSYDALRLPWRLALDYQWYKDPRDAQLLGQLTALGQLWRQNGMLPSVITHDGTATDSSEAPAMYGGSIGYFIVADQQDAADVYNKKLQYLYDPGTNAWVTPLSYYDDNWAWFGIALYNQLLPNLYASLPASLYEL